MIALRDSIEIKATPEDLFNRILHVFSSSENYRRWHPDHIQCRWIEATAFETGSILYVEENLHGELHRMKFRTTKCEPNRTIEYRILFPASLICPGGSFDIEQKEKSCIFTATLYFRFTTMIAIFAKQRAEAVRKHMKEEGENLKRLLEA